MGKIVAAMATVHAPQLFTRPPTEIPEQLDADIAAMRELGKSLDETLPDVIVVFGSDHLETFFLSSVPTFAVIAGETTKASFAGHEYELPVHLPFAEDMLEKLVAADFDMAYSQDAVPGHAFAAVYEWVIEGRKIPVIPIFINTYLPPLPSARRCQALGRAIAKIIEGRPENVALVASGGMSHYPGTWKYPEPAFDFDYCAIDRRVPQTGWHARNPARPTTRAGHLADQSYPRRRRKHLRLRPFRALRQHRSAHPEIHAAMVQALTFRNDPKLLANLALYEQRITKNFHVNLNQLLKLQSLRQPVLAKEKVMTAAAA